VVVLLQAMAEDDALETPDLFSRRLDHILMGLNIVGALLVVGYMVVAIDEMTGGALKRRWEAAREKMAAERKRLAEWQQDLRRVEFEAFMALQDKEPEDGT